MTIQIYEGINELSRAAADLFANIALSSVQKNGYFIVSLSGGSTPMETYKILAENTYKQKIPWDKVYMFWGDERCVPFESEMNNARMTYNALLKHVPVPEENVFRVQTNLPPEEAAKDYESQLRRFFSNHQPFFDLVLLGLGKDGHTASLFPFTPALNETDNRVKEVYIKEASSWRITLTLPVINRASNIAFLVSGHEKSKIFNEVTRGAYEPARLPAQLVKPEQGMLYWLIDKMVENAGAYDKFPY
ncbi:MAG: 6-phosphogluconolactonase [Ignavibacteria bacterium]